ncbi:hypothetical protein HD554DRAFT_1006675 [Boletus coccyginus]|nr:hypothetical protein HD554DRAFT_1006675 [Boletus coccyginus]
MLRGNPMRVPTKNTAFVVPATPVNGTRPELLIHSSWGGACTGTDHRTPSKRRSSDYTKHIRVPVAMRTVASCEYRVVASRIFFGVCWSPWRGTQPDTHVCASHWLCRPPKCGTPKSQSFDMAQNRVLSPVFLVVLVLGSLWWRFNRLDRCPQMVTRAAVAEPDASGVIEIKV